MKAGWDAEWNWESFYFLEKVGRILLPQIDDVGGLIEKNDGSLAGDPLFAIQFRLQFFPRILPGPEEVGAERNYSMPRNHLIEGNSDVLLQP